MSQAVEERDAVREQVRSLMKKKGASPSDLIEATGFSKNTVYEFLSGKRGMRSGNSTKIVQYLKGRRNK